MCENFWHFPLHRKWQEVCTDVKTEVLVREDNESACQMAHLTPKLKDKVDELFLRWLSMPATQKVLRSDLHKLIEGRPLSPRQLAQSFSSSSVGGANRPVSPPAPPASSPSQLRSPRSPRERSSRRPGSKSPPRSPRFESNEGTKYSMKENHLVVENDVKIFPGCASHFPQFHFPLGKPDPAVEPEVTLKKVAKIFKIFEGEKITKEEFGAVAKVLYFIFVCLIYT